MEERRAGERAGPRPRPRRLGTGALAFGAGVPISPIVPWLLVGLGALLRLRQYLFNRSLWLDESMLSLNVLGRSFGDLLRPLDSNQHAPLLFLMVERLVVETLGSGELALRLFPFVAGLATLVLAAAAGRLSLQPGPLVLAMALLSLSGPLVYYSSEVKQYSSDAAVAVLLLWTAARLLDTDLTLRRTALFAGGGAVSVWLSHPAVFVLAGTGAVLLAESARRRDPVRTRRLIGAAAVWSASFAAVYFVSLRRSAANPALARYWSGEFPPVPPRSLADLAWFPNAFLGLFANPVGVTLTGFGAFAFLASCLWGFRGARTRMWLLLAPIVPALIAGAARKYPIGGRFLLFFVPSACFLIGEGSAVLRRNLRPAAPPLAGLFAALLLFHPATRALDRIVRPQTHQEIRSVLSEVRRRGTPGDLIYGYRSSPGFRYYLPRLGFPADRYVGGRSRDDDWRSLERDLGPLSGRGRVWVVFAALPPPDRPAPEVPISLHLLDGMGRRLESIERPGAAGYLYDLSDTPPRSSGTKPKTDK